MLTVLHTHPDFWPLTSTELHAPAIKLRVKITRSSSADSVSAPLGISPPQRLGPVSAVTRSAVTSQVFLFSSIRQTPDARRPVTAATDTPSAQRPPSSRGTHARAHLSFECLRDRSISRHGFRRRHRARFPPNRPTGRRHRVPSTECNTTRTVILYAFQQYEIIIIPLEFTPSSPQLWLPHSNSVLFRSY